MASKALLLFGLFTVLLIASKVAARDLAETSTEKSNDVVEEVQHPDQYNKGDSCSYGCCLRGYGQCASCCSYAGESVQTQPENEPIH